MQKVKCRHYCKVVGYCRPVDKFNRGKQKEFNDRKNLKLKK